MSIRTSYMPRFRDLREWPRYILEPSIPLTLRVAKRSFTCHIEDISLGGARLRVEGALPSRAAVLLEHPYVGEVGAQRLWQETPGEGRFQVGIAFDFTDAPLSLIAHCLSQTSEPPHIAVAG